MKLTFLFIPAKNCNIPCGITLIFMYKLLFKRKRYVFSVVLKIHGLPTASYWYCVVLRNKSLFGLEFLD